MTRRPVVYHIVGSGRRHVAAASELVTREGRIAVELDPDIVKAKGVFVEIDPEKLRKLDEEGWVSYGYPERVDRRQPAPRRRQPVGNQAHARPASERRQPPRLGSRSDAKRKTRSSDKSERFGSSLRPSSRSSSTACWRDRRRSATSNA